MCGIVGLHYFDSGKTVAERDLLAMNDAIRHRGPDDAGHKIFGSFGMAMRRLSIIDLSGGHQPIANEDSTIWVVFNGEIYNFKEVRRDLEERGHTFRTNSDTEVFVHGYEEYGDDFVGKLNGMFGFALWDDRKKRLILGRDRLGVKPIYYFANQKLFAFASEFKSLMTLEEIPRAVDLEALDEFLTLEYTLAPRTLMKGVRKLKPGHLLVIEGTRIEEKRYWKPNVVRRTWTEQEACAAVRKEVLEAVERRLISDVPLGAFLSGGIDSSIIVGLMSQIQDRAVKTFSIGFDDASYNELEFARLVSKRFRTEHYEFTLKPDPASFLDDFKRYLDEPIGDVSIFPTFLVSKVARQKVTVVLSGDGGDEMFGGYDWYAASAWGRQYDRLPSPIKALAGSVARNLPPSAKKKGWINKLKRFTEGTELPGDIEQYRWMSFLTEQSRESLYAPEFYSALSQGSAFRRLREHFGMTNGYDALNRQIFVDLNVYLPEDILMKVDIASMANSLEARGPFLDYKVAELALSLPGSLKIRNGERKYILKKAFADLLPPEILSRRKEGFSIPMKNWLKQELKGLLLEVLNPAEVKKLGFFRPETVERLVSEHLQGSHNHAHRLWCLIVFALWHDKFMRPSKEVSTLCPAN